MMGLVLVLGLNEKVISLPSSIRWMARKAKALTTRLFVASVSKPTLPTQKVSKWSPIQEISILERFF